MKKHIKKVEYHTVGQVKISQTKMREASVSTKRAAKKFAHQVISLRKKKDKKKHRTKTKVQPEGLINLYPKESIDYSKLSAINNLFFIASFSRSGFHCTVNWLLTQFQGHKVYFDKQQTFCNLDHRRHIQGDIYLPSDIFCVLFENKTIGAIADRHMCESESLFARAYKYRNIIVLRDPFNWLASFLQIPKLSKCFKNHFHFWQTQWIQYMKEALCITNQLPNKLFINYNKWFVSKKYRMHISQKVGGRFSDRKLNVIPRVARYSSFDGLEYQHRAQEMKVLDRWQFVRKNPIARSFLSDPCVLDLALRLFGSIEPIDYFKGIDRNKINIKK